MEKKKMYNPNDIYFGNLTYNTRTEGYYYCSPEPFEKIVLEDGAVAYKQLNERQGYTCREFYDGITDALSVQYLIPLTKLIPEEKHNQPISRRIIKWHLLKYWARFDKYNKTIVDIDDYIEEHQKSK